MKRAFSTILIICILTSSLLFSCQTKTENTKPSATTSTPTQETPKYSERDQRLMDNIISIMEEKEAPDYNSAIEKYFGDFCILNFFSPSKEEVKNVSKIYKSGDILAIEYKSGESEYQALRKGKLYSISKASKTDKATLVSVEDAPQDTSLNIFSAFGIDMSAIYSFDAGEDEFEGEMPKLNYEDLNISEDRKTVTFSNNYLLALAKLIVKNIELEEHHEQSFLETVSVNGGYFPFEQKLRFKFTGTLVDLGELTIEMETDAKGQVINGTTSAVTIVAEVDGIKTTTTQRQAVSYMVSKEGEVYHVEISNKRIITVEDTKSQDPSVHHTEESLFAKFTLENSMPSKFYVSKTLNETETTLDIQKQTNLNTTFNFGGNSLYYDIDSHSTSIIIIDMDMVTLFVPKDVYVPQDVLELLPKDATNV